MVFFQHHQVNGELGKFITLNNNLWRPLKTPSFESLVTYFRAFSTANQEKERFLEVPLYEKHCIMIVKLML